MLVSSSLNKTLSPPGRSVPKTHLGYPRAFRAKRCLIYFKIKDIKSDWTYVKDLYFFDKKVYKKRPELKQQNRIQNKILTHEGYKRWTQESYLAFNDALASLVQRHPNSRALLKALMDLLNQNKFALPAYSTLQRLMTKILRNEKNRLFKSGQKAITKKDQKFIKSLLITDTSLSPLESIRLDVKDFNYAELRKEIKKRESLHPLFNIALKALKTSSIPKKTIDYYGSLVNFYSIYKLRRMPLPQASWYLLCYSFTRYQKVNDNLVQFFKHYVSSYHEECKQYSKDRLEDLQKEMEELLVQSGHVLQLFTQNLPHSSVEKQKAFQILPKDQMIRVSEYLLGNTRDDTLFYWNHVDALKHKIVLHLRALFLAIDFTTLKKTELYDILCVMEEFIQGKLRDERPLKTLIPKKLLPYLLHTEGSLNKERFEFFFYKKIARHIETQKLTLSHTYRYKSLKEELIPDPNWDKQKPPILKGLGYVKLSTLIEQTLEDHKNILNPLLETVNERIKNGENKNIKVKYGTENITWTLPYKRKKEQVNNPFFLQLPQVGIVDLLYFVEAQSGFLKRFTPIQQYSLKESLNTDLLLAVIIANAIRLGSYQLLPAQAGSLVNACKAD